jgi:hypothetical protein
MTSSRKTIEVEKVLNWVNTALKQPNSEYNTPARREAIAWLYECIAIETGQYAGFTYQSSERDLERTNAPLREDADETRRIYIPGNKAVGTVFPGRDVGPEVLEAEWKAGWDEYLAEEPK